MISLGSLVRFVAGYMKSIGYLGSGLMGFTFEIRVIRYGTLSKSNSKGAAKADVMSDSLSMVNHNKP